MYSKVTKKYAKIAVFLKGLSIIVLLFPILYYFIYAFVQGEAGEKLTLGMTFIISAILFLINIIFKYHIRSVLWILVLGIYFCIDSIMPLLLMIAIGTILDEFILTPLYKSYKNKTTINKEIDKRM